MSFALWASTAHLALWFSPVWNRAAGGTLRVPGKGRCARPGSRNLLVLLECVVVPVVAGPMFDEFLVLARTHDMLLDHPLQEPLIVMESFFPGLLASSVRSLDYCQLNP